jgi:hypothetical protein
MKFFFTGMIAISLLAGCVGSNPSELTPDISKVNNGSAGTINYCRPKSIMRVAETVDIYINGEKSKLDGRLAAKIKNGNKGSVSINLNENFTFGLKPSLLFMRSSDQIAFSDKATSKKDRFFVVKGKPNYDQSFAILIGGAIGAAELDKTQDTGKENWEVTSVSKSQFESSCK